ncbi:MAG: extracellular solute-binding protein [Promicromonosporaceae bacterium]|nr:extracellular solute-binding protein [Promicromonosporaceae bacterium]
MKTKLRAGGFVAAAAALALVVSACGDDAPAADPTPEADATEAPTEEPIDDVEPPASEDREPVHLVWWHNGTGEPLLSFWQEVADQFTDANPHVTIDVQAFQNEDLRTTILPNAIAAGTQVDLFQSWGGGELLEYQRQGLIRPVTDFVPEPNRWAAEMFSIDGEIWGMPYTSLPSGFWVNMNVWEDAGLTEADFPTTLPELEDRWATLAEAGHTPVAVGGAPGWPAAHWWYWTALRNVPASAMAAALAHGDFTDPGWIAASEDVAAIIATGAWNSDWASTSAQEGATSASGRVVLGEAAMQLMGTWDFAVMGGIYNEQMGLPSDAQDHAEFISWFPFPQIPGAAGDPGAIMGGVDGFSVGVNAPDEAAELLAFIVSTDIQRQYAAMGNIPIDSGAMDAVPAGPLVWAADAVAAATSVQLWLDTALGAVGAQMNDTLVAFMQGQGTPEDVVNALTQLAVEAAGVAE